MSTRLFCVLFTLLFFCVRARERLNLGDSISVQGDVLISPSKSFSAGFLNVGSNAYCFSVWFTHSENKTVVWMANRDRPVPEKGSSLRLRRHGALVLLSGIEGDIWEADTESAVDVIALELLEKGNLVLKDRTERIVWESFDFPTDTLLPGQKLTRNTVLLSNRAAGSHLSGFYTFAFNDDNVLYLTYRGPDVSSVYWPRQYRNINAQGRTNFNNTRLAMLDEKGFFSSSDSLVFHTSDYGKSRRRRLTLDHDGLLRAYSLNNLTGEWEVVWVPPIGVCDVDGHCGAYGVCFYAPEPTCSCPLRFIRKNKTDWSQGCAPEFNLTDDPSDVGFLRFPRTYYYGYSLETYSKITSLTRCRARCRKDLRCRGFGFTNKACYPKYALFNGQRTPDRITTTYIKVPATMANKNGEELVITSSGISGTGEIIDISRKKQPNANFKNLYLTYLVGFVGALGAVELIAILLGFWFVGRTNLGPLKRGYRLQQMMGFRRFTYKELKKVTGNFKEEIGRGGFGPVYKGLMEDGRTPVAVKKLERVVQGETEFWAEVSLIGRINHLNLVRACGFCAEGKHRLLVYEYLEKGSLDKLLFSSEADSTLTWSTRYDIALGIAMGLAYIHEECLEWVLHCDVKPQNILLDNSFRPKLADFGMSKLADPGIGRGKLEMSRVRGTRGYMAPEWLANQEVTAKVDVYSYGVVLLELVTGRSAANVHGESDKLLIQWVQDKVKCKNDWGKATEELVDTRLQGNYDIAQMDLVIRVALMCVKSGKEERPAMSAVVGLLHGEGVNNIPPARETGKPV